jgi:hypothetical protein
MAVRPAKSIRPYRYGKIAQQSRLRCPDSTITCILAPVGQVLEWPHGSSCGITPMLPGVRITRHRRAASRSSRAYRCAPGRAAIRVPPICTGPCPFHLLDALGPRASSSKIQPTNPIALDRQSRVGDPLLESAGVPPLLL